MKKIILVLSIIIAASCSKDNDNATPISYTEIGKGALYGNGSEGIAQSNMVITNTTDWHNLMNQMNTVNNVTDDFLETNIDFNNYIVIAIFTEVKPNGWEVEISDIEENTSNIRVYKTETSFASCVMAQAFHIVKIPVTSTPIVFD